MPSPQAHLAVQGGQVEPVRADGGDAELACFVIRRRGRAGGRELDAPVVVEGLPEEVEVAAVGAKGWEGARGDVGVGGW